jgi:hypothetical protein
MNCNPHRPVSKRQLLVIGIFISAAAIQLAAVLWPTIVLLAAILNFAGSVAVAWLELLA